MRRHRRRWLLPMLALLMLMAGPRVLGAEPAQERNVKAAFLSKFIGFVEFAESASQPADGPLVIGVLGADDIALELKRIVLARPPNQRPLVVRVLGSDEALAGMHMLFVGGDRSERTAQLLDAAARQGILTVTEVDSGLRLGSTINFRRIDDRVRFEISLPAAQRSNLKLSARLLAVAYHVQKEPFGQ